MLAGYDEIRFLSEENVNNYYYFIKNIILKKIIIPYYLKIPSELINNLKQLTTVYLIELSTSLLKSGNIKIS